MKVKCYYRVAEDAPICEGTYDYDTGLIDGVKPEHFCVRPPEYFYKGKVGTDKSFVNTFDLKYYLSALLKYNALAVITSYEYMMMVITRDGIICYKYMVDSCECQFNYTGDDVVFPKDTFRAMGTYETYVKAFSVLVPFNKLYVDTDGGVYTPKYGHIKAPPMSTKEPEFDFGDLIGKSIKVWKKGNTGLCFSKDKKLHEYKVQDGSFTVL